MVCPLSVHCQEIKILGQKESASFWEELASFWTLFGGLSRKPIGSQVQPHPSFSSSSCSLDLDKSKLTISAWSHLSSSSSCLMKYWWKRESLPKKTTANLFKNGRASKLELLTDLVFLVVFGWYFLVLPNQYRRKTWSVHFGIIILVGTPFFLERGVMAPFFRGPAHILRKKGFPAKP